MFKFVRGAVTSNEGFNIGTREEISEVGDIKTEERCLTIHVTVAITESMMAGKCGKAESQILKGCKDRSGDQQSDAMYFRRGGVLSKENLN